MEDRDFKFAVLTPTGYLEILRQEKRSVPRPFIPAFIHLATVHLMGSIRVQFLMKIKRSV